MASGNADRNMLIGIIALQLELVTREQLLEGMHAWLLDKETCLDEILVRRGTFDAQTRDHLLPIVDKHIALHSDDPKQSLASLSSVDSSICEELASLNDPAVAASLTILASRPHGISGSFPTIGIESISHGRGHGQLRYRILRPHAKGGLGKVSVALDTELNREVALKEIQSRLADEEQSRSRFMQEAEITGGLEHPGIVPVYGLGTYSDGRPFYAMRFIRGDSLQEAADAFHSSHESLERRSFQSLEFRKLLGRFVDVCNAIEYAHSRGVLHRDLKPGNIMLGKYGETLVVDWGLSKVVGSEEGEESSGEAALRPSSGSGSAKTQFGTAIGTPQFMSPEQAEGDLAQLGPASDVYSLGATLYYLLTGRPPFDEKNISILLKLVAHGEFRTPRSRLPAIPKALEAICVRAMAISPHDRYDSPAALVDELESWLADEPVGAYQEPFTERWGRWIRRHQTQAIAGAIVTLTLMVCLGIVLAVVSESNQTLTKKNEELIDANKRATNAELEARRERDMAVAISDFLTEDLLRKTSPYEESNPNLMIRTVLDRAGTSIEERFREQPFVEFAVRSTIGSAFSDLGEFEDAEHHLRIAWSLAKELYGENHISTLEAALNLGKQLNSRSKHSEAEEIYTRLLTTSRSEFGDEHEMTLDILQATAVLETAQARFTQAEKRLRQVLEVRQRLKMDDLEIAQTMNHLADLCDSLDRLDEAQTLTEAVLEITENSLGESHPRTIAAGDQMASYLRKRERLDEAGALYDDLLARAQERFGPEHREVLRLSQNKALLLAARGDYSAANQELVRIISAYRGMLGDEHMDTLSAQHNLASVSIDMGLWHDAEVIEAELLDARNRVLGPEHPHTLSSRDTLATALQYQGRYEEALPLFEQNLALRRRKLGNFHSATLSSLNNLALFYMAVGEFAKAEELLDAGIKTSSRIWGERHSNTLTAEFNLASLLRLSGRFAECRQHLEKLLPSAEEALGESHIVTNLLRGLEGTLLMDEGNALEAEVVLKRHVERMTATVGPEHPDTLTARNNLIQSLLHQRRFDDAEPLLIDLLDVRRRILGEDHPHTLFSKDSLATLYQNQYRFDDAQPLFESVLAVRRDVLGKEHPETLASMNNLALIHRAHGKIEEASALWEEALAITLEEYGLHNPMSNNLLRAIAILSITSGDLDRGIEAMDMMIEAHQGGPQATDLEFAGFLENGANFLLQAHRFDAAARYLRRCLMLLENSAEPIASPLRVATLKTRLGKALLGLANEAGDDDDDKQSKMYQEAEMVLLDAHQSMQLEDGEEVQGYPAIMGDCMQSLIELYEKTGRDEEAMEWEERVKKLSTNP